MAHLQAQSYLLRYYRVLYLSLRAVFILHITVILMRCLAQNLDARWSCWSSAPEAPPSQLEASYDS